MKILIADDDAVWVRVLFRYFGGAGHEVLSGCAWEAARALAGLEAAIAAALAGLEAAIAAALAARGAAGGGK